MTIKEFEKKWGTTSIDAVEDTCENEFLEDVFNVHETAGFREKFNTPWTDKAEYNGLEFEVIGRSDVCDVETMPMWRIKFANGDEIDAFPEEICNEY